MMTTETTASQPKSIGDDAQFRAMTAFMLRSEYDALVKLIDSRAPAAQASATIQAAPDWKLGTWFEARTLDEMEAFYMSRLPMIREAAKEHGYAIGLHGTARRDFDLMAMQWRADASDKDSLARAIADAACGIRREGAYDWEVKPSGRVAVSIPVCWTDHGNPDFDKPSVGHIDLSLIEFSATIQEPVMVAEPVENCPVCEEGTLVACHFHWCNKCGVEVGTTADAKRNVEIMKLAAPMVADPAGVVGCPSDGWPDEIYLNAGEGPLSNFSEYAEVDWCDHPQGENDVRYIRAELSDIGVVLLSTINRNLGKRLSAALAATVKAVPSEALELTELADAMQYWGGVFADGFAEAGDAVRSRGYSDERWVNARSALEWMRNRLYKHGKMGHPDAHAKYGSPFPGAAPLADKTGGGE